MTNNRMFLQNGTNFIVDPSKESDTVKARQEKIHFLLGVNLIDVARNPLWKTDQIRALATGLVKTTDGKKRLHKDVLIENLKEFQESERKTKAGVLEAMIEDGVVDAKLIDVVFLAVSKNLTPKEVNELILNDLRKRYTTDQSLVKTGLHRLFKAVASDDRFVPYAAAISKIREELKTVTTPAHNAEREANQKRQEDYQSELMFIKESPVVEFIQAVLSTPHDYKWVDVAYAIALTTGRRMAEILGNHSTWKVQDGKLIFTGLLKTKHDCRINEEVHIKVIGVDPQLVVDGIDWLSGGNDSLKNYRIDHNRVNPRYSKEISTRTPQATRAMQSASRVEGHERTGIKQFKDCRDFHAAWHLAHTYDRNGTIGETRYIQDQILFHADMATSLTYTKYRLV